MVRLTSELLLKVPGYLNTNQERELCLRGMKISVIENLATLQDQYDLIDFTDNEIIKLDNFPRMNRLQAIFLSNNYISRISPIGDQLPSIDTIILTNNKIAHIMDLMNLTSIKNLTYLSLLDNPVTFKQHYREYLIYKLPNLKLLDYKKVTMNERKEISKLFHGEEGLKLLSSLENDTFTSENNNNEGIKVGPLSEVEKQEVRDAIERATTRAEIDIIEKQLKTGTFPFKKLLNQMDHQSAGGIGEKRKASDLDGEGNDEEVDADRLRKHRGELLSEA